MNSKDAKKQEAQENIIMLAKLAEHGKQWRGRYWLIKLNKAKREAVSMGVSKQTAMNWEEAGREIYKVMGLEGGFNVQ